jgi:hypothetical protein
MKYDLFEQRVWRSTPGDGVRHFVFLPDGRLVGEYNGTTGAVVREYIWMGDVLIGLADASGVLTYIQTGPLGQPLVMMDAAAAVVWRGEQFFSGSIQSRTSAYNRPPTDYIGL